MEAGRGQERVQLTRSEGRTEGPQRIERRHDAVVAIAADGYDRVTGNRPGFREFLLDAPDLSDLNVERDRSPTREVGL